MDNEQEVRVGLGLNLEAFKGALAKANVYLEEWADKAMTGIRRSFNNLLDKFSAPALMAGAGLMFKNITDRAEQITRVADATGLTTTEFQKLAWTFQKTGASAEDAEKAIQHLADTLGQAREGEKGALEIMERWGISLNDANGIGLATGQIVENIATQMANEIDPVKNAAEAHELYGRAVTKAVEAMKDWKDVHGAGALTLSPEDIAALHSQTAFWKVMWNNTGVLLAKTLSFGAWSINKMTGNSGANIVKRDMSDYLEQKERDERAMQQKEIDKRRQFREVSDRNYQEFLTQLTQDNEAKKAKLEEETDKERIARLKEMAELARSRMEEEHSFDTEEVKRLRRNLKDFKEANADIPFASLKELARTNINAPAFNLARIIENRIRYSQWFRGTHGNQFSLEQSQFQDVTNSFIHQLETGGYLAPNTAISNRERVIDSLLDKMAGADGGVPVSVVNMPQNP